MIELMLSSIQDTGLTIFLGSAVIGVVISVVIKRFNLTYIATHEVLHLSFTLYICIIYMYFQVDKTSKRHGGEIVAQTLKAHGISHIFINLTGGHISPILAAAEKLEIKVIDTRHEVDATTARHVAPAYRSKFILD